MYYPKSQIKTDLYTNGNKFSILGTKTPYIGDYYTLSTGKSYTGKNPNTGENLPLVPFSPPKLKQSEDGITQIPFGSYATPNEVYIINGGNSEDSGDADPTIETDFKYKKVSFYSEYSKISDRKNRLVPQPSITKPTDKDLEKGVYRRYFVKNLINSSYFEISKETFQDMNRGDLYANDLFNQVSILFYLGKDSFIKNLNQLKKVEASKRWNGFSKAIPLGQIKENYLYTKGYEFTYLNRKNYIGYYHFMPNGKIMTGKYHGDGPEIELISLKIPTTISSPNPNLSSLPNSRGGGGY